MRVAAKDGQALLLAAVHLDLQAVLAAGLIDHGLARVLGQHLQLDHGAAASPQADSQTVVAGVAAAYDDYVLPSGIQGGEEGGIRIQQGAGGGGQIVHRRAHPLDLRSALHGQRPGVAGAYAQDDGVILACQFAGGHVHAHVDAGAKFHALGLHGVHLADYDTLFQLHIGDAVLQQPAGAVAALIDGDGVAPVSQVLGRRQPRWTGAHHGHPFPGGLGFGLLRSGGIVLLHHKPLQPANADGLGPDAPGAVGLALPLLRAQAGAHLRQHGGGADKLVSPLIVLLLHPADKLGDRDPGHFLVHQWVGH